MVIIDFCFFFLFILFFFFYCYGTHEKHNKQKKRKKCGFFTEGIASSTPFPSPINKTTAATTKTNGRAALHGRCRPFFFFFFLDPTVEQIHMRTASKSKKKKKERTYANPVFLFLLRICVCILVYVYKRYENEKKSDVFYIQFLL